jgi:hypothetical protein
MPIYTDAKYFTMYAGGPNFGIAVKINGVPANAPIDPANTDYANMMVLVAAGELVIAPAGSQE